MDPTERWGEVNAALGLIPTDFERGAVLYRGERWGLTIALRLELQQPGCPARLEITDPASDGDPFLLLPRAIVPGAPLRRTGDPVFDQAVAIVYAGDDLLACLYPGARQAVAAALALGASLHRSAQGPVATLPTEALARLETKDAVLKAIEVLADAVTALRSSDLSSLVARFQGSDVPEVQRCISACVERSFSEMPTELLARVASVLVQRRPGQKLPDALVARAGELCAAGAAAPMVELVLSLLRHHGLCPAFHQLWASAPLHQRPALSGALLDLLLSKPRSEWVQPELVLALPGRAATATRLVLRGRPFVLERVAQRPHPRWLELLLSLSPSREELPRLASLLAELEGQVITTRLLQLLPLRPEIVAPLLARRALLALREGRWDELAALKVAGEHSPLLEALLTLPEEALPWLAQLRPMGSAQRLRLMEYLSRFPGELAEEALLSWLQVGPVPERSFAAQALGRVGAARALKELEALAGSWLVDTELRAASREAAAAIRARHVQGGLSLAKAEGGWLSPGRKDG